MSKLKLVISLGISLMPLNILRISLYRILLGYTTQSSHIGFGTIIVIDQLLLKNVRIGNFNFFTGPFSFSAKDGSTIGSGNIFRCGKWATSSPFLERNFARSMKIGENVTITNKHYFDTVGSLTIGNDSWIAGYGSQFWTHAGNKTNINIHIGCGCYLASAVRFTPGTSVADNSIVGLGSVISKNFNESNVLIAGNPATIKKTNYNWKKDLK